MHIVGNGRVDIDGDIARSESYLVSCQDVLADGVRKTRIRAGRYVDRFERRNGTWKIAARTMIDEWARIDPVGEAIDITGHSVKPARLDNRAAERRAGKERVSTGRARWWQTHRKTNTNRARNIMEKKR